MNPYGGPHVFVKHWRENSVFPVKKWPFLVFFLLKSTHSWCYSALEKILFGKKIRTTTLPKDPVFILGHYRSGTTLLHKLLSADPRFGYINTFDLLLPNCPNWLQALLRPLLQGAINLFKIKQKFFHNYTVKLTDPNEEEPVMLSTCSPWSVYWGYVFPRRANEYLDRFVSFPEGVDQKGWQQAFDYYVRKFSWRKGNRQLVLKDPPHTGRVKALLELYPNAKFIHIYRNPYRVYASMQKLWKETIGPDYSTQLLTDEELDTVIFEHYRRMMRNFEAQKSVIPAENLVEIRYEDFRPAPLQHLKTIYSTLKLPDFEGGRTAIENQLKKEKSYQAFSHSIDPAVLDRIEKEWGQIITKWGYARPE